MLSIENLTVSFSTNGQTDAIRDISLEVPDGQTTVLVGETGSGKSILLLAVLRLLPATARVTGRVLLDGTDLLTLKEKQMTKIRGNVIGYIPQGSGSCMNPLMKVGPQVGEPLTEHRGFDRSSALHRAVALMKQFHIGEEEKIADSYPHVLSGGMRQRAVIAMGVAADSPYLFADEPTKGLDPPRIADVTEAFSLLKGKTMLCVTHDLRFARSIADRVCILYASRLLEVCTAEEFYSGPLHPYSRALLASQPENGLQCQIGFAPSREDTTKTGCIFCGSCPKRHEKCLQEPPMTAVGTRKVRCWLYADRTE